MSGTVTAVVFDLGGVITESPMIAFAAYEREAGLPDGLIRQLNSTDPDRNAWARFERNELDVAGFSAAFEAEAAALGHRLDASRVLAALRGEVRPAMVTAIRRLKEAGLPLGMVSNNVSPMERGGRMDDILDMFDVVVVDEASQAGLEATFLQYLAPKIVVIGDDKQVSPAAVGVDEQQLRDLGGQYLADDRYRATWQDPKRSQIGRAHV